jgi:D-glycero-beta-D-manno-heptose 1-phosphate adenylyltransferase
MGLLGAACNCTVRSPGAASAAAYNRGMESKRYTLSALQERVAVLRARGGRLVVTNGCFDLLHVGHVRYLQAARALGDFLTVGLNSDASTRRLKGPERPLVPEAERAEVLAALTCVDAVVLFDEPTAEALVAALRPEIYVKGDDYSESTLPEARVVQSYGGEIRLLPTVAGLSTTALVERIRGRGASAPG